MSEQLVKDEIYKAVLRAATSVSDDVRGIVESALARETNPTAKIMLGSMVENLDIANSKGKGICQSPGYPTSWISFGDGNLPQSIADTVGLALGEATQKGYLRPSIVDPLTRINSGDNSGEGVPNIEYEYVPNQNYVDFYISFKGCGAELGNVMKIMTVPMIRLNEDFAGLKRLVLEAAINAGGKPCPPFGIGVGIGGQMDVCSRLSRKAISTRKWNDHNSDPVLDAMEQELKDEINSFGLGAAGCGGDTVCYAVKIAKCATHTAIAPVAINFHCWVARRAGVRIYDDGRVEKLL